MCWLRLARGALIFHVVLQQAPAAAEPLRTENKETVQWRGTDKPVCVIEGEWRDGGTFRYQAWTRCRDLSVGRLTFDEVPRGPLPGRDNHHALKALTPSSEIIEVANDYSRVILFRGADGRTIEVMISD